MAKKATKRNAQDTTLRNNRAQAKKIKALEARVLKLERAVARLTWRA